MQGFRGWKSEKVCKDCGEKAEGVATFSSSPVRVVGWSLINTGEEGVTRSTDDAVDDATPTGMQLYRLPLLTHFMPLPHQTPSHGSRRAVVVAPAVPVSAMLRLAHLSPQNGARHRHTGPPFLTSHVPPFRQSTAEHTSTSFIAVASSVFVKAVDNVETEVTGVVVSSAVVLVSHKVPVVSGGHEHSKERASLKKKKANWCCSEVKEWGKD